MENNDLLVRHPSMRNSLALVVWPILAIPGSILLLKNTFWETMPFVWMLIFTGVLLLFPAYAWLKTRFFTYVVRNDAVYCRKGLLSHNSNEIRIADIRAINVRQSLTARILRVGDIGFSSAAGDEEEVTFMGVPDPIGVKKLVQGRMAELKSGRTTQTEPEEEESDD